MNITLTNIDPVNAIIKVDIINEDYAPEVEKELKKVRQNANVPGFRKGMVPMGMIKKLYEKSIMFDQVNKMVSTKLYDYIRENKINILGEPLPNTTEQKEINFDEDENFEFCFDIALAPEIKVKLTKRDKLHYYTIKVDDNMIDQQITSFRSNYGTYGEAESIEGKDMAKGLLVELDENGSPKEDGIKIEDAVLMPSYMKDEEEKAKFMGTKKNTVVTFSPFKAYEGNEAELSSLLKITKEEVNQYQGNFTFEITEITRYSEAEINQELFDKVFGPDSVKTEEEFREKVKDMITAQFTPDSDYKFLLDAKKLLEKKAGDVTFPDAFLKRWLLASGKDRTEESIEEDYPKILEDLKFHLIKEDIIKVNEFKLEENELLEYAQRAVRAQFAQYGMANVPEDLLNNYANDMLKKEDTVRGLIDKVMEDKLVAWLKERITLETEEVSSEDFRKLFE